MLLEECSHLLGKGAAEEDECRAKVGLERRIATGYLGVGEEGLAVEEYEEFAAVAEESLADFEVESLVEGLCGKNP